MSWWQKKLLRFALSRTGLLDDAALDVDNFDITIGRKNVVELKDVGLNIKRISKLAQLPPNLRIEAARVLALRLTVPADIYQSGIVADVDGVELTVKLEESDEIEEQTQKARAPSPVSTRIPQHRKVHRRLHSPPPYDPGGLFDSDELHIPTAEELAKSFLQEEPARERRELEASVAATSKALDESIVSESSDGGDLGTGGSIGVPGFLAGFLQGIVDRFQITIRNVEVRLETELSSEGQPAVPVTLRVRVGDAQLSSATTNDGGKDNSQQQHVGQRQIRFQDISLDLLSDATVFSELSEMPSPPASRREQSPLMSRTSESEIEGSSARPSGSSSQPASTSVSQHLRRSSSPDEQDELHASMMTADEDRFADAGDDPASKAQSGHPDLEIQPGDDNLSWGSRRSKSDAPAEDLWSSMLSEDDLPESLMLQRAPTPRADSSKSGSPRNRRDVSPYARSLQSPGSWPRIDESPQRHRQLQSPGSWPTLDQSHQSAFQPLAPGPFDDVTDNKRTALEASAADLEGYETPPELKLETEDDLMVSRMFSHEQAESMYMSAIGHSSKLHVPGGWGSEHAPSDGSQSPEESRQPEPISAQRKESNTDAEDEDLAYGEPAYGTPGNATPRARTPEPSNLQPNLFEEQRPQASKHLLYVDTVSVWLPVMQHPSEHEEASYAPAVTSSMRAPPNLPGTFSAYSEMSASRHNLTRKLDEESKGEDSVIWRTEGAASKSNDAAPLEIDLGSVKCQLDMSCGRLLHRLVSKSLAALDTASGTKRPPRSTLASKETPRTSVSLSVGDFMVALRDSAHGALNVGSPTESTTPDMLTLRGSDIDLAIGGEESRFQVGLLSIFVSGSRLLSFDRSRDMMSSRLISDQTPDIAVIVSHKKTIVKRPIVELKVETLPLEVLVDLQLIDDTLESFGGLSGVLEVGNSYLADSVPGSPVAVEKVKGVRFEGDLHSPSSDPEIKLNGRIGGVCATLQGSTCYVQLRTTTIKTVHRQQGTVATLEQLLVTGPHLIGNKVAPLSIDFSSLRLEYLLSPQDKDLERLLSLLTPSKDKYDTDDDILLDTLLRQRRKGAILRASIANVKLVCRNWECITTIQSLGDELSKLSAVTKYLPEDERPGILTLLRLREIEAILPVNTQFGNLHIGMSDLHVAHVGLPALLALSVGRVGMAQESGTELIHPLILLAGTENLPMVMVRMLGDEVEPTIKVKLFNLCLEYSVPIIVALTGLPEHADTEEVVTELAKSVANLGLPQHGSSAHPPAQRSDSFGQSTKKMNIDVLIHDCAVGLSPQKLPSKGLLVLTDTHFSTLIPPEEVLTAKLALREAALFVANEVLVDDSDTTIPTRSVPNNTAARAKVTHALSKQGFISVGSILKANINARVEDFPNSPDKTIDVDLTSELLLLETCADSTQTLISILNGLTPPTPPSKQPKYLTEPMKIEDMMASFTGDAFAKPEKPPETLFDVDEEPEDDPDMMLDVPTLGDVDDDLLADSEMTSSLYGPISGILGGEDSADEEDDPRDFAATAESLLEDDPFEMPNSPTDTGLSDAALVRELNKQSRPAVRDKPIDLGNYEIEDLGFDALGSSQAALGSRHRFNTPISGKRTLPTARGQQPLPFRMKVKDLHVIWNIHDGYDWQRTREGITQAVEQVELKSEERAARRRQSLRDREDDESAIGDFLFNSIYIGVPSNQDAQDLRRQINRHIDDFASESESVPVSGMSRPTTYSASGRPIPRKQRRRLRLERSREHKIAFELKGVSAVVLVFPPDSKDTVSSVDVRVKSFEIFDNVPTSTWRKFLSQFNNDPAAREMSKPMVHLEIQNVRTLENFAASEVVVHASLLPLRLHVDQDALDFITRFFEFKDDSTGTSDADTDQPFLQRVEVDTVDMCLDYKPKRVDYAGLRSGHTTEFKNFIILDAANIRLKHAILYGIKGFDNLHTTLNDVWLADVKRNQLPTVLSGLAPVRSLVNIGSGVRDVIAIPVREYKKDGRIVRSIQKGALQFGKTTTSELARLGAKVAIGTQTLLQGAEGFLTPASASPGRASPGRSSEQGWHDFGSEDEEREPRAISAYANQPLGVLSGLRSARRHLEYDLLTARDALIAVQGEILESSSASSAAAAVVKHAPTVLLRPVIGASRAVGTALLGVGNQIDRGNLRRIDDKYKRQ